MKAFRPRFRRVLISLLLLGLAFFLYHRHRGIEEHGALRWIERPIVFVTAPVARLLNAVRGKIRAVWDGYFFLVGVEKENDLLQAEMDALRTRASILAGLEQENERLRGLLDLRSSVAGDWIAARVVSYPPVAPYRMMTINRGEDDGVHLRAPVITAGGLVGQVARVFGGASQVLLIVDPTSAVDASIEGSGARGLIIGKSMKLGLGRDYFLSSFEYLSRAVEIDEGSRILTSGLDGIFPPGIVIGSVYAKKKKKYDIFQQVEVVPAVDFFKVREVLVLK